MLTYDLVTDPNAIATQMRAIVQHVPADAAKLIDEQMNTVVIAATGKKGLGLELALVLVLFGAMKGAGAVAIALHVTYNVTEDRSFIHSTLINAAVTIGAVLVAGNT
ncbi:YhjD/YihY/BrkB family envelope integrity protein [Glacieibacterium megasporae]|uniref:YhjD/YihY/BrkB family envelope integrity protein n=1 Tax=Glacieibacterium megasporae TaxID=2835787 RepID=UPI001C1DCF20|nr:YhjD/YihY/BrkB family envelope integrity protein [Polymorphobacter megasporae]UAJ12364.1 hypothetical protein KTC28_21350 [Polymorphobacter megasporae]